MTDNHVDEISVRQAHLDDRERIEAAQSETAEITFGRAASEVENHRRSKRLCQALKSGAVRIAEIGGAFAGYWWVETYPNGFGEIIDFYVERHLRSAGVADSMLDRLTESAIRSGVHTMRLVIADRNATSCSFFTRRGATCVDPEPSEEGLRRYELRLRELL